MNIFIEGLQGTGKSTLANRLAKSFPTYGVYREGDYSPVELAWCAYMGRADYEALLRKYAYAKEQIEKYTTVEGGKYIVAYTQILAENPQLYKDMEKHEIYNGRLGFDEFKAIIQNRYRRCQNAHGIYECSFFQNSIEDMMLFYEMPDGKIVDFYREAFAILRDKNFVLLYLDDEDIRENILQIKRERTDENGVECWFPMMMEYLRTSPYGMSHGYQDLDGLTAHLKRRRMLELKIIEEVIGERARILPAKKINLEVLVADLVSAENQASWLI